MGYQSSTKQQDTSNQPSVGTQERMQDQLLLLCNSFALHCVLFASALGLLLRDYLDTLSLQSFDLSFLHYLGIFLIVEVGSFILFFDVSHVG